MSVPAAKVPPPPRPAAPPPPKAPPGKPVLNGAAPAPAAMLKRLGESEIEAPRIVINGVEGIGKTTLASFAPDAAILMARGETGFATLRSANLVPDCPAADIQTWAGVLSLIDSLIAGENVESGTLVLDAIGGFERLCHEHVCNRDFNGDWGERGFGSYQKGFEISVNDWLQLLQRLDRLREKHRTTIVILAHTKIKTFKNPGGADYDRYACDCHEKTWSVTHKWADLVGFFNFRQVLDGDGKRKRVKGIGDCRERVIYTQRHDSYDAKNRFGMDGEILMPEQPAAMWATLWSAITKKPIAAE